MSVPAINRTVMTTQAGHWWSGVGPMDVSQARSYLPPTTGPTAGDGTSVHHGTAEQNHRSRNRDRAAGRVRSRDRTASATGSVRSNPMGPQEHMDWMAALEVVVDRIGTLERHTRLDAQSIAHEHEAVGVVSARYYSPTDFRNFFERFCNGVDDF